MRESQVDLVRIYLRALLKAAALVGVVPFGSAAFGVVGAASDPSGAGLRVEYTLPEDGEVTLGLYSSGGALLRTIISSSFRHAGVVREDWDGLDQWGHAVPAGSYRLKGIYHPHITTNYVMSFGNPGSPPWPTPDGKGDWLSDESAPQGAATDGKWVFLAAPGNEKGYSIIAVDERGQRQWGTQINFNPCTVSLTIDRNDLYALFSGPQLIDSSRRFAAGGANAVGRAILMHLDKNTGHALGFSLRDANQRIAQWPYKDNIVGLWNLRNARGFSPDVYSGQPRYANNELGETTNAIGIAAAGGFVYVAMHDDNKILILNAETAARVGEIALNKPAGLFALPDHSLLAISGKTVVHIDPSSGRLQTLITGGLSAPRALAADRQGAIYVSDWGDSFQVKVFSESGTEMRAIGKSGGRPWLGAWDESGMLLPTGIAITDSGKLWVAEDDSSPNRISVWDAGTGAFLKDYLGPTTYGGGVPVIDPKDPSIAYALGLRLKLNEREKTYLPLATIDRRMSASQPFYHQGFSYNLGGRIAYHDGHEYMIFFDNRRLTISERQGELFVPAAAMSGLEKGGMTRDGTDWNIWDSDLGTRQVANYFPPFFRGHAGDNYTWTDTNGDGLVQYNEMTWYPALRRGDRYNGKQVQASSFWGFGIGDDWSIYWSGFCADRAVIYRLDVKGWTSGGVPIYNINDSKPIAMRDSSMAPISLFATQDGHLLVNYSYEDDRTKNTVEYLDRNGRTVWAIAHVKNQGPTDIQYETVAGELNAPGIGPVYGTWAWHGNYEPYLFTADGLYVASLLKIGRLGPEAGWDESLKTYFQSPSGASYIINGANDANHVLEIQGLAGGRFQGHLTLSRADVARASIKRAMPAAQPPPAPIISIDWPRLSPTVDGNLHDWDMNRGVRLIGNQKRVATIALSRDASNIYIAAQVTKDTPLSNNGDDWRSLFTTGDCVDVMLSTDPKGDPHRKIAVLGDERLLIALYHGKPIAVLYRPVFSRVLQPDQLAAARIDRIAMLNSARIAINAQANSYSLEAAIPLADLGISPTATDELRGDVGVIFADETGGNRIQRLYYYNQETKITSDLTTEATLQPGEWGYIQLPLGPNLIVNGGFESPLVASTDAGWNLAEEQNGAHAELSGAGPRSGKQALLMEQLQPVAFTADALAAPNYDDFIRAANHGSGGGHVEVTQAVSIMGGHSYNFRLHYRTDGLRQEKQTPGNSRGYSRFRTAITWSDGTKAIGSTAVLDERSNHHDWQQLTNWIASYWSVNKPYLAPIGATRAIITLSLDTMAPEDLPTVFIDDLEMSDESQLPKNN